MKPLLSAAQRVINDVQAFGLTLDCPNMVLTHETQTYRGPGRIVQNPDGYFDIQHFPVIPETVNLFRGFVDSNYLCSHLLPGQIIESGYFKVEAVSIEGDVWVADRVWIGSKVDTHNRGVVLSGTAASVTLHGQPINTRHYVRTIAFHDELRFPANGSTTSLAGTSLNKTTFTIGKVTCALTVNEKTLEFSTDSDDSFDEALHGYCLEALQFVAGREIKPFYKLSTGPDIYTIDAVAVESFGVMWSLEAPVECQAPFHSAHCISLVQSIVRLCEGGKPRFLHYHRDIAIARLSGLEPAALAACVVVDGMAEQYFKSFSAADPIFVAQCEAAIPELKRLGEEPGSLFTERVVSKLLGSLSSAKSSSSTNTLYKLFDVESARVWNELRHPAAHGSLIDKNFTAQKLFSNMMTCVYMYYAMALAVLEYEYEHVNYSVQGYPLIENVVIAAKKLADSGSQSR
ncbi:hypothetical protein KDX38_08375 [Pseudomonas sp. CDFA 602]|uniref:hypothetical protein n=1 Tax=Pseudomonas californiensis TaxID=2829823 RepID=UPI001E3B5297|nr:hypothetical protein [Pseudomonas californiensis]MCD5993635.1 hypothetical protein [Pseudomonas californiensis]MCD5999230.1 hypothetical protein [Pseudomonas californiensis]